ncbi:hypothetical protein [Neisseria dumasiana]|uniref:hypothetical protein n=1 Tax=Neisseria dumasiana TaxID=1931275 RepID=UPI001556A6C5|nr:hypothetical protein [Neisseria dumasiana]
MALLLRWVGAACRARGRRRKRGGVLHVYRCGRLKTGLAGFAEILFNPLSDGL